MSTWATMWKKCSEERGTCHCAGTVAYGRKYAKLRSNDNAGQVASFEQMLTTGMAFKHLVDGSIQCTNAEMGTDPYSGFKKQCMCLASSQQGMR